MPRILLIEDEPALRESVAHALGDEGYRVLTAADGETGLASALSEKPDAIVLDIMLPKRDGFSVCRELRRRSVQVPVLMMTAKGLVEDRVTGLDAGADDYLVKPFSLAEFHARLRALLRRAQLRDSGPPGAVTFGGTVVDLARRRVTLHGREVNLTAKEYGTLELLVRKAGQVVSREDFLDLVWGYASFPSTRTVDNHIARLRARLAADDFILTVPRAGYRLEVSP